MNRKRTPLHDYWHRRVEGQIRHTMNVHPKWFSFKNETDKKACINSLAKRIVGEIIAAAHGGMIAEENDVGCAPSAQFNGGSSLPLNGEGVGLTAPSLKEEFYEAPSP